MVLRYELWLVMVRCRPLYQAKWPNIVYKVNKSFDVCVIPRGSLVPNVGQFVCINMDAFLINNMSKAVYALCIQVALFPFEVEFELSQSLEYNTKVILMFFYQYREYKNVI